MPYISKERVAQIRNELKEAFPDYIFSVTTDHGSGVNVLIMAAPVDFTDDGKKEYTINHYWYKDHFAKKPALVKKFDKIMSIVNKGNGILVVDGDYGAVPNFYVHLGVGRWDKPFRLLTPEKAPVAKKTTLKQDASKNTQDSRPRPVEIGITHNIGLNGIEIRLSFKPSHSLTKAFKEAGWRWHAAKQCWYAKVSPENIDFAQTFGEMPETLAALQVA